MKNSIKICCLLMAVSLGVQAQQEISLCEGSGVHCMEISYGEVSLKLVKGKSRPEIIIKPKQS